MDDEQYLSQLPELVKIDVILHKARKEGIIQEELYQDINFMLILLKAADMRHMRAQVIKDMQTRYLFLIAENIPKPF